MDTTSQSRHEFHPETDGGNEEPAEQGCRVGEMLHEVWRSAQDTTAWEQQRAGEDADVVEGARILVFATRERERADEGETTEGETDGEGSSDGSVGDPEFVQESGTEDAESLRGIGEAEDEAVDENENEDVDVDEDENEDEDEDVDVKEEEDVEETVEGDADEDEDEYVDDNEGNRSGYEAETEIDSKAESESKIEISSFETRRSKKLSSNTAFVRRSTRGRRNSFPDIPDDIPGL